MLVLVLWVEAVLARCWGGIDKALFFFAVYGHDNAGAFFFVFRSVSARRSSFWEVAVQRLEGGGG